MAADDEDFISTKAHLDYDDLDARDIPIYLYFEDRARERMNAASEAERMSGVPVDRAALEEKFDAYCQRILHDLATPDSNAGQFLRTEYEAANPRLGPDESAQWSR